MTDIPKPAGYEFRVKLQQRSSHVSGTKWQPQDALFSASEMLSEYPPQGAFLVCWYTPDENGRLKLKFQGSQEHDCQMKALASEMASYLVAP
jgi:hypothetical protein